MFSFIPVVYCSTPVKHFNPATAFGSCICNRKLNDEKYFTLPQKIVSSVVKYSPLEGDVDVFLNWDCKPKCYITFVKCIRLQQQSNWKLSGVKIQMNENLKKTKTRG